MAPDPRSLDYRSPGPRRLPLLLACLLISLAVRSTLGLGVVRGLSMWPTLRPGDTVVFARVLGPTEGSMVVAELPEHGLIVKRVAAVTNGTCFLLGDNRDQSYDSRDFGPVPDRRVLGRVIAVWTGREAGRASTMSANSPKVMAD